jgi:hypothetical protein
MQSQAPSQSFIWGVLAHRFESELTLRKSRIWRLSGFQAEYGGPFEGDRNREHELKALIEALSGVLAQAVAREAGNRKSAYSSKRRPGRPKDVMTPYLGRELLSVFLRCHDRAGRKSVVVGTTTDGKAKQGEAGELFLFIDTIIQPLIKYLTTELHRGPLSAARLARFALDDRGRMTRALAQSEAKPSAKKPAVAVKRELPPLVRALQGVFAMTEEFSP